MKKVFLLAVIVIVSSTVVFSQSAKKAKKLLLSGNIPEAIKAYEKLVEKYPEKGEYHMNLGECYLRTPQIQGMAIPVLQKAVRIFETKHKNEDFINAKFLLGEAYHVNYLFDEAIQVFNELIINKEYKKYKSADILKNEIRACEAAKKEFKKKKLLKVVSPGPGINTEMTQHSPFYIEDKGIFIYTSKEKTNFRDNKTADGEYDENIFFINLNNENDREPDPYSKPLNSKNNEADCWVSKDGTYMLLYKDGDIYQSEFKGNNWTKPTKFKPVDSKYNETHASMNQDRTLCYFSSDRPGGRGGKDIYYIKKTGDKWSEPKNLGRKINTKFDEESPFIHADGILYFSSKGHNSIGGYDIFSAEGRGGPGKFSKPVNLGMPINSVEDDLFYFVTNNNKIAYFMSKRPEGKGRGDIYKVNYADSSLYFLTVKGNVTNTNQTLCNVRVADIMNKNTIYNTPANLSGDFSFNVKRDRNYFVALESDNHYFEAFTFSAPYDDNQTKNLGSYSLQKIEKGKIHKIYSMNFDKNSKDLNNENDLFLNTLARFLNKNPDLVINLYSSKDIDENLAKKRKQEIINFLNSQDISENRIFVDLTDYNSNKEDILVTVLDSESAKNAFNNVVANNNTNAGDLDNGGFKGIYTIQLGAFRRKLPNTDRFFKDFRGKVKIRNGNDVLYHYTYGKYKYKSDAEKYLVTVHKMGFKDAFIRELEWYK
ncbi:MAG: tetratricopeptide repeat protein [Bacteroidales bacterium]|nr:tetratricopeptide repeat protein [Bacteroidales bacterium]